MVLVRLLIGLYIVQIGCVLKADDLDALLSRLQASPVTVPQAAVVTQPKEEPSTAEPVVSAPTPVVSPENVAATLAKTAAENDTMQGRVIEPGSPETQEPGNLEEVEDSQEPGQPKSVEPKQTDVEAKQIQPTTVEPKLIEPKEVSQPKVLAPKFVEPTMAAAPKFVVPAVVPVVEPPVITPGVVAVPGVAKIVSAPAPQVAVADQPIEMELTNVHEITQEGLDTLHVDTAGNWLEKRIWYKKAEQLFEEIRTVVQKTTDIRMQFVHSVNQVGQHIDDFYEKVGFKKGEIDELLIATQKALDTEKEIRGGDLSSQERSIKQKIKTEQQQFESISKDFKLIEELDDQIDKTMMKAFKEIDACRSLETKAWNNFKDIGMELDDKKARVLYYEMENFYKNIEQKIQYLQSNLLSYLQNQLVNKVTQTAHQIQGNAQVLYSKGLNIQTLLQKDAKGDFVVLQDRDDEKAKETEDALAQKDKKQKKSSKNSWYQSLADTLVDCFYWISDKAGCWLMIV